jgi:hypothetical protein
VAKCAGEAKSFVQQKWGEGESIAGDARFAESAESYEL